MERISNIIIPDDCNVRVYLLKKQGYKGNYTAVIFPNAINDIIKKTYADNYANFISDREISEYDSVHSEKGTIKKLPLSDLVYWPNILEAMSIANREGVILNKNTFTDDYSAIVLVYEKLIDGSIHTAYLLAQYRKIDTWYKKGVKFGFTTNTIEYRNEDIFVLNGCIDTAVINDDVFVLQENAFEKVFNYYEKSKRTVTSNKAKIEAWGFINEPKSFYTSVENKKGPITKLARALDKTIIDFSQLTPQIVRKALVAHEEFSSISFDDKDRIIFIPTNRDLIIDILRYAYTRGLFFDDLVHTKGI